MNLHQAIHLFIETRKYEVTRKTLYNNEIYLRSLGKMLGEREIESITLTDLRSWRASLFEVNERYSTHNRRKPVKGGYSLVTLKGMIEAVRQLFNWLTREGHLDRNPALKLTAPNLPTPEPRTANPEALNELLRAAAEQSRSPYLAKRNVAVILLLRDSGCRLCGVAGLRLRHLDLERREALVYEKGRGGKSKARLIYFKAEAQAALCAWLEVRPQVARLPTLEADEDYLFLSDRYPYPRMTEMAIACMFRDLKKRAGIVGRVNPHSLRHGLAKRMLLNGASLGQVSRILGHADIRITDKTYGVFATHELKEAFERYA